MKGNTLVRIVNKIIRHLVGIKNRQIRFERERSRAVEESNKILSAYIALLAKKSGEIRVSREEIGRVLGQVRAMVSRSDEDYVITIEHDEALSFPCCVTETEDGDE